MEQIICLIVGYVFGLFQTGFIYDKSKGIDIRQYGSGNSGSTNALRVMGVKAGLVVLMGDFLRTVIPCFLVRVLFRFQPGYIYVLILCAGFGVILGHNLPFYLRFKGGKRITVTAGIMSSLDWRLAAVCLLVFALIVIVTRYVSLGSLVVSAIFLCWNIYFDYLGAHGLVPEARPQFYAVSAVVATMAFWRHRANIVRLAQGRESKVGTKKRTEQYTKDSKRQLMDGEVMALIGVIGSGIWGTALSVLFNGNRHMVQIWSATPQEIAELKDTRIHRNLSKVRIPEVIRFTGDLEEVMRDKDLLVFAAPPVFVRQISQRMRPYIRRGQVITNMAREIEEKSLMTLSQVIKEELPETEVIVFSGPSHTEEVSRGLPTTCVAGVRRRNVVEFVQGIFMSEVFRVYTSPDVLGIELGGALKNVIALTVGMADGLGYGDNIKAALITRGVAEISRLDIDMGGRTETFAGLIGIGDLIVICASMHSRNCRAGILIGQSRTTEEAMAEVKMMVKSTYSARAALTLSQQYEASMSIVEQVSAILFGGMPAKEAVPELMPRDKRTENSDSEWVEE